MSDKRVNDDSYHAALQCALSNIGPVRPGDDEPEDQWYWDKLTSLLASLTEKVDAARERDLLATAIIDAAVKSGIYRHNVSMTGPQLLQACDDMAECIKSTPSIGSGQRVDQPGFNPMETAPRDGTTVRLLVQFDENEMDDESGAQWTIGHNSPDDEWQFAGWDWQQDCYTEGKGVPVGWLPLGPSGAIVLPPAKA